MWRTKTDSLDCGPNKTYSICALLVDRPSNYQNRPQKDVTPERETLYAERYLNLHERWHEEPHHKVPQDTHEPPAPGNREPRQSSLETYHYEEDTDRDIAGTDANWIYNDLDTIDRHWVDRWTAATKQLKS